ncbi:MAG: UbiD family decarboxylase [Desulfurococcales archaeon]|nr:UbiD family decarboxylase [Desulfurococcales archaeon]
MSRLAHYLENIKLTKYPEPLDPEYQPACLIKKHEKLGQPVEFTVREQEITHTAAYLTNRQRIRALLNTKTVAEAYMKLLKMIESPPTLKIEEKHPIEREGKIGGANELPWIKYYEKDGGYYLTSPIIVSCMKGICNASIHRIMRKDDTLAIRIVPRHLYTMLQEARAKNESLPVTIILGVHPIYLLLAATSPEKGLYELAPAASALGDRLYKSPIHEHPIPDATIVAEAYLEPEDVEEGPFVDAMGTYDRVRLQPKLKIEKVYYRPGEPVHSILPGGLEHAMLMGFPREAQIYQTVLKTVPRVHKVRLTPAGGGWLHAVVSITKNTDGDAKNAILAAFAGHPSLKHVIVVDQDIDPDDPEQVEWAIATRFQAHKDLILIHNARGSTLDPSSKDGLTSKMGMDATKPLKGGHIFERAIIPGCKH